MEAAGAASPLPPTEPPPNHPAVAPLAFLLGKWRGEGEGSFPTISSFRYGEEILFSHHPSKPVISYTQKTWKAASGEPMNAESGYWRPRPDGSVDVVIAQSTGLAEVQVQLTGTSLGF
ncbi:peroxynitrite isomerase Rv2717c-like isoform X1 [Miscanthus floridulus]|uniref:peroxynitrite isomerase Rv2717c-like isoform X1 n=1 Tax=Miscanthus floridulus TaxID=154761 RepID=UPI0034594B9E